MNILPARLEHTTLLALGRPRACAVCKNLLLGGMGAVTLMDDSEVTEADLRVNFFFTPSDLGKNVSFEISHSQGR